MRMEGLCLRDLRGLDSCSASSLRISLYSIHIGSDDTCNFMSEIGFIHAVLHLYMTTLVSYIVIKEMQMAKPMSFNHVLIAIGSAASAATRGRRI
jgi:hypothetical protein